MLKVWFIDDIFASDKNDPRLDKLKLIDAYHDDLTLTKSKPAEISKFREESVQSDLNFDLIVVDYKLEKDEDNLIFKTGNEIVSLVRSISPDVPIYLLSVYINKNNEYERVQMFERTIGENFLSLPEIFYREICNHRMLRSSIESNAIDNVVSLLDPPEEESENIKKALPKALKSYFLKNISSSGEVSNVDAINIGPRVEFYRWFIDYFYPLPGFLFDSKACAVYLGISIEYFRASVIEKIQDCLYKGIFYQGMQDRWWKSKITDFIIALDTDELLNSKKFSEASSILLGATSEDKSRCVICGEQWPERIGRIAEAGMRGEVSPVHIKCSLPDEDYSIGPYFERLRMIEIL